MKEIKGKVADIQGDLCRLGFRSGSESRGRGQRHPDNKLYIITHGEWRPAAEVRFQAMLAAMPENVNPDLIASLRQT